MQMKVSDTIEGTKHMDRKVGNSLATAPRKVLTKAVDIAGFGAARRKQHLRASPRKRAGMGAAFGRRLHSRKAPISNLRSPVACKQHIKGRDVQM